MAGKPVYTLEQKVAFIRSLYCPAKTVAAEYGSSYELILAQAAQETGWGEKVLKDTNNVFNIKADSAWTGKKSQHYVPEVIGGKTVWGWYWFRDYDDYEVSLRDRMKFLADNPRYGKAGIFKPEVKGKYREEAQALHDAGYATDPNYAKALCDVVEGRTFRRAIREAEMAGCCEQSKLDWSYPYPALDGKDVQDSGLYLGSPVQARGALAKTDSGFYPVGANGVWHGGIHFDAGSGTTLLQSAPVRCISAGEIVAYRVDQQYPEIEFTASKKKAAYSSGFVLVRHRLELPEPPKPAAPAAQKQGATTPAAAKKTLTFYSLYMHLLDYTGYQGDAKKERPSFWSASDEFSVGDSAKDSQELSPAALPPDPAVVEAEFECGCDGDGHGEFDFAPITPSGGTP